MGELKTIKLEDEIRLVYGKSLTKSTRIEGEFNVYGSNGVVGTHNEAIFKGPGLIIGRKGTVGSVVLSKDDFYAIDTTYVLELNDPNDDLMFWYYYLKTLGLDQMNSHSAVPGLSRDAVYRKEVKILPDINERKRVAATLSCLDDKIELNNRMNKNLEEMAQAIFKSWFVDFEPFQDGEFEESELGMIPKGWRVGTIDELIENTIGGDWGKENEQGNYSEEVVCIRGADIPEIAVGKRGKPPIRFILKKNLEKKQLFKDQIIIEISGGSPTQSTGRTALITDELLEAYKNPLICTNFCRALSFKKKEFSTFVYSIIQYFYKKDILFLYENGTTGIKNLDTGNLFGKHQIIIPDEITFKEYYELYHTLLKSIYDNGIQADKLSTIRDTLLPKLMSGEIRVPIEEVE